MCNLYDVTCKLFVTHYAFALTDYAQVNDCEDILGDDIEFLSAMSGDLEGNKSDEVGFICSYMC